MFPVEGTGILNDMFSEIPVSWFPLPPFGKVLEISSSTSVAETCRTLLAHNFLCAPVYDEKAAPGDSWMQKYLGIVDVIGIVHWLLEDAKYHPSSFEDLLALRDDAESTPITALTKTDRWTPFVPISPSENTMLDVMMLLGKYGVRRVCVLDTAATSIANIITQSSVTAMLATHLQDFSGLVDLSLKELELTDLAIPIVVSHQETFWTALKVIVKHHISAVPIVDDDGVMVANLSAHDIRRLFSNTESFGKLGQPVKDALELCSPKFTCTAADSLASVITQLVDNHIHRVYITDESGRVEGVLSLREVIAQFVREPEESELNKYFATQ